MTFAHGESVTIQTATLVTDPYSGGDALSWDNPTETTVDNVLVGSGGSTEPTEVGRASITSDFDLIFQPPYTTLPTAQDRVVVRGLTCTVDGRPFLWRYPGSGEEAGTVVRCSIREG